MVPWVTPPVISGFLATAGDIRTSILQILMIVAGAFIYLPFMRASELIAAKIAGNTDAV
jgi:PTS system cellobiose-specific IIC component